MKAAILLLLFLAAFCANAAPANEDCPSLTKDLHQVFGPWVLVFGLHRGDVNLLPNVTSSHIEFSLQTDNKTVFYDEWNTYQGLDSSCSHYAFNMSIAENHTLEFIEGTLERDGVVVPYNDSAEVDIYRPEGFMVMVYRERLQQFLLIYKREGVQVDVEAKRSHFEKLAACFSFKVDKPFIYDGVSGFCHKKSNPDDVSPAASS